MVAGTAHDHAGSIHASSQQAATQAYVFAMGQENHSFSLTVRVLLHQMQMQHQRLGGEAREGGNGLLWGYVLLCCYFLSALHLGAAW